MGDKKRMQTQVAAPITQELSEQIDRVIRARLKITGIKITRADFVRESLIENLKAAKQ